MSTTRVAADLADSLDVWFKNYIPRAESLFVASGYFDNPTAIQLLNTVLKNKGGAGRRLRIVLNAGGAVDLNALQTLLDAQDQNAGRVEVRLVKDARARIFHPKVFAAFCSESVELVVGSGNLTRAAETNDELYCYLTFSTTGDLAPKLTTTIDHWTHPAFSQDLTQELVEWLKRNQRERESRGNIYPRGPVDKALAALELGCVVTPLRDRPSLRMGIPSQILGNPSQRAHGGEVVTIQRWVSGVVQLLPQDMIRELDRIDYQIGSSVRRFGLELADGRYFVPLTSLDDLQKQIKKLALERGSKLKTALGVRRMREHFHNARVGLETQILSLRTFENPEEKRKVAESVDEFLASAAGEVERRRTEWCSTDGQALKVEPHPARIRYAMPRDEPSWKGSQKTPERQIADAMLDMLQAQLSVIMDAARTRTQTSRKEATRRAETLQILHHVLSSDMIKKIKRATTTAVRRRPVRPRQRRSTKKVATPPTPTQIYVQCEKEVSEWVKKQNDLLQGLRKEPPIDALIEIWNQYQEPGLPQ